MASIAGQVAVSTFLLPLSTFIISFIVTYTWSEAPYYDYFATVSLTLNYYPVYALGIFSYGTTAGLLLFLATVRHYDLKNIIANEDKPAVSARLEVWSFRIGVLTSILLMVCWEECWACDEAHWLCLRCLLRFQSLKMELLCTGSLPRCLASRWWCISACKCAIVDAAFGLLL